MAVASAGTYASLQSNDNLMTTENIPNNVINHSGKLSR